MPTIDQVLLQHQQRLREAFLDEVQQAGPRYASISKDQLREGIFGTVDRMIRSVVEHDMELMHQSCVSIAMVRGAQGFTVEELQSAGTILRRIIYRLLDEVYRDDCAGELAAIKVIEDVFHIIRLSLAQGFVQYEQSLQNQLETVMVELSAPIVPVYKGVLVMPLVGSVDSRRAAVILETMLESIARLEARVIILDITGVPVVDTNVANYLLQAVRAVRLLGTEIVLTGISPSIAETMVQLGSGLGNATTRANLAGGVEYALAQLGLAIQPLR